MESVDEVLDLLADVGLLSPDERAALPAVGPLSRQPDEILDALQSDLVGAMEPLTASAGAGLPPHVALGQLDAGSKVLTAIETERTRRASAFAGHASRLASISAITKHQPRSRGLRSSRRTGELTVVARDGRPLPSLTATAEELAETLREWGSAGFGSGLGQANVPPRVLVASAHWEPADDGARLGADVDVEDRMAQLEPLIASGQMCSLPEPIWDTDPKLVDEESRPVRDSLPRHLAARGQISYVRPPVLSDVIVSNNSTTAGAAISMWDFADGTGTKSLQDIVCDQSVVTVAVQALVNYIRGGNFERMYYPERIASFVRQLNAAHARASEQRLLAQIDALAASITTTPGASATRDLLGQIENVITRYTSAHRLTAGTRLTVELPTWVKPILRADLAAQAPGDQLLWDEGPTITDATLTALLSSRGADVVWGIDDGVLAARTAGALGALPTSVTWRAWLPGTLWYLDGGRLDLGVVYDTALIAKNMWAMFSEEMSNCAWVGGPQPVKATSTLTPTGITHLATRPVSPPVPATPNAQLPKVNATAKPAAGDAEGDPPKAA